ncbi:response regulator [Pelagibacterium luteolum]|uniref:Response regulator receiver domain-containing protein n=1 Tax=Pelagibacterium luteolum TaxID=440168 RepID=A0A1G7VFL5_9HYPH|nr:response regulator [Pelagibacterium luteolum]SDG58523.1 Response regulator receiver domain-containing protein [Pelagibacterium luteolum]
MLQAIGGEAAIELIATHPDISLLFTDVVMPGGMNGAELAKKALEMRPELRVLFTSGYSANAIVHDGRLDTGVELLSKPYSRDQLANRLRIVLQ